MRITAITIAAAVLVFLADAILPSGVSVNVLYVVPLCLASHARYRNALFVWAAILSVASSMVPFVSPQGLAIQWEEADRALTILVLWYSAVILYRLRGQRERALRERAVALEATNAKTRFFAAANHDLRQPMQSMFFFVEVLRSHVPSEKGRDAVGMLERSLEALKGLLDSMLDVSRLDAGVVTPQIEDFVVKPVLDHAGAEYVPLAAAKGLELQVVSDGEVAVRSDRVLLGRMVRNLVENAIRYTEAGSITIRCFVAEGHACIEVRDTGIGIPREHLTRIFEEFFQVGNPERDRQQGLGLGLSIVRRLSQLLDHPVAVESEPGKGSRFRITVPLGEAVAEHAILSVSAIKGGGQGRMAVLVDDDVAVLKGLQTLLQNWGYETLAATSTEQALELLQTSGRRPDIVIADYRLREGKIGSEAIVRVRKLMGPAVPGILLTGEMDGDLRRKAAAQAIEVVVKPVLPGELHSVLNRYLGTAV
ncbi:ATP-binding response regulator [Azospirillum canadense]|uniref:ATP-binding response regulator n=1 Tax=Azospirillum canadense TaxID=403962 RepID=UPI00222686FF|nr:hybrid sensor histidine kinase/response regulator [Azospirillum canadense]MCW2243556.1 signal transduction histidine kinase/CheY-like chemotaxis protein [Azospirillum canadense]